MSKIPFPKAVLFDFDGVIVNSKAAHHHAWGKAFEQKFNQSLGAFPHHLEGKAPIFIATYFAEQGGDVSKAEALNTLKKALVAQSEIIPSLLPGVRELVALLQKNNIPHGIASNAYTNYVEYTVTKNQLPIDICMGVDQFDTPKPSPIPYLTLAKKLNIAESDFSETLIFEDSLTGIQAAAATGMYAIGLTTQRTEKELIANGAQKVFPTLLEAYQELLSL